MIAQAGLIDGGNLMAVTIAAILIPFFFFYLGIIIRFAVRGELFKDDKLKLKTLCIVGIIFAFFTILPLSATLINYHNIPMYLGTLLVVIQAGFFMPESLARTIESHRSSSRTEPQPANT